MMKYAFLMFGLYFTPPKVIQDIPGATGLPWAYAIEFCFRQDSCGGSSAIQSRGRHDGAIRDDSMSAGHEYARNTSITSHIFHF